MGAMTAASDNSLGEKIIIYAFLILFVSFAACSFAYSDIVEVDAQTRRIKMIRSWFGKPWIGVFDVSFDQCTGAGIERTTGGEGPDLFHVYLQLTGGRKHRIPKSDTNSSEERLAKETLARFIAATGLPRLS
jgi:hypothetical protein